MKLTRRQREHLFGYLFISLWIIGFMVFTLLPIIQSAFYSTKTIRIGVGGLEVVQNKGFANFKYAFTQVYFIEALLNYSIKTLVTIPTIVVFSVIIAMLLNQKIKFRGVFRVIYFLPVIISSGPVLTKIQNEGFGQLPILSEENWLGLVFENLPGFLSASIGTMIGQIIIVMWFTGVPVLFMLAGLQKVDTSIYEAAAIDGASKWESFWKITLPAIKPLINISIVFSMISISLFSANEISRIVDSRKYIDYGLVNAYLWIYFVLTIVLLAILLGLANLNFKREPKVKTFKGALNK